MPKYEYKCPECGHEYNEYRDVEHPQWKTTCVIDGCSGVFQEITPAPTADPAPAEPVAPAEPAAPTA